MKLWFHRHKWKIIDHNPVIYGECKRCGERKWCWEDGDLISSDDQDRYKADEEWISGTKDTPETLWNAESRWNRYPRWLSWP